MSWHYTKANSKLQILPGESPGGEDHSKTYKTFDDVRNGALRYLQARHMQIHSDETPLMEKQGVLARLKAREMEIGNLKITDIPKELFTEETPGAKAERYERDAPVERRKKMMLVWLGIFALVALARMLSSLGE